MNTDYRNKKLIVFDLDGTLAPSKSPMSENVSSLLCRLLQEKQVAVIGGGSLTQFQNQFLGSLVCPTDRLPNLYLFPTSGTSFYRYQNNEWHCVYKETLSPIEREQIITSLQAAFKESGIAAPDQIWGEQIEDRGSQIAFSYFGQEAPLDVKKTWDPDAGLRSKVIEIFHRLAPDFAVHAGGTTTIDITKPGIDKAYGVDKMTEYLGIPKRDMLFIGDAIFPGGNDYPVKAEGVDSIRTTGPEETAKIIQSLLT
jgi:HAD superfamily hydrolase (TIGR01484 family)